MKKAVAIVGIVLCAGVAGSGYYAWANSDENLMRSACIDLLKQRLKSPSSFELIDMLPITYGKASWEEFRGIEPENAAERHEAQLASDPKYADLETAFRQMFADRNYQTASTMLEYEADNAFGASIRSAATCKVVYASDLGDEIAGSMPRVRIDGYDHMSWILSGD